MESLTKTLGDYTKWFEKPWTAEEEAEYYRLQAIEHEKNMKDWNDDRIRKVKEARARQAEEDAAQNPYSIPRRNPDTGRDDWHSRSR